MMLVMPNDLLTRLQKSLDLDATLVVLSGKLKWRRPQALKYRRDTFLQLFHEWRSAVLRDDRKKLAELHGDGSLQRVSTKRTKPAGLPADPGRLSSIEDDELTILSYPPFPGADRYEKIMMQVPLSSKSDRARHLTLYWETDHTNRWRIVHLNEEAGPV